jgi:Flp pilus assembly protein TadD
VTNDPETHAARGAVLQRTGDYAGACRELERAIQLRPRDYFLWMLLGVSRDLNSDQEARASVATSNHAAPVYAKPHWLLGNLLLRTNETAEAVRELQFAATSDETSLAECHRPCLGNLSSRSGADRQRDSAANRQCPNGPGNFLCRTQSGCSALEQFISQVA